MSDAGERIAAALERIADVLERSEAAARAVHESTAEPVCFHPEDQRKDYSTMGVTRWACGGCGFSVGMED